VYRNSTVGTASKHLLQSVTFISRLNALDYTKLRS